MPLFSPVNIILVDQRGRLDWRDLRYIAKRIVARSRLMKVHIVSPNHSAAVLSPEVWKLPTITVSFGPTGNFNPPRGVVFTNRAISKTMQAARLSEAGVATPKTAAFQFGMRLDPEQWGEFAILKPASLRLTSKGKGIYLYRTGRLAALKQESLPLGHMARRAPMLVQQFIDTGEHPSKQRVTTLFGEPFHWARSKLRCGRPPLTSSDEVLDAAVVSTGTSGERDWSHEMPAADILELARRAGAVFSGTPLLGLDILRCAGTGKLYVLEINAGGNVWHYSSPAAAAERAEHPERFPNQNQKFRSFDIAAEILIKKAIVSAT